MVNYNGLNQSVLELSHRSPEFNQIAQGCRDELRRYLNVPEDFEILLGQGGASIQYTSIVKNLIGLKPARKAMYLTTGHWSKECVKEARKFVDQDNLIEVAEA
mmetsp:Transcript_1997/g.3535  ORF Transcript_1997/g.3535 Transcript_1997/m.3535 type:complete len:103 (-) Transcript_1997:1074-1382(-)